MNVMAVHSAARRYCMVRLDALTDVHRSMSGERGPEQHAAWLASVALRGILPDIERVDPAAHKSTAELRDILLERCSYAQWPDGDVRRTPDPDLMDAAATERARFRNYLTRLTDEEAARMPRLPHRRTLDPKQRRSLLNRVARAWPAGGDHWHPLLAILACSETVVIQSVWVGTDELPVGPMRRVLAGLAGGPHLWELHEGAPTWTDDAREYTCRRDYERVGRSFPPGFELDPALWWTTRGTETLWASARRDWLLHAHHEAALYIAGHELVARVKDAWPNWHDHVWTSPFSVVGPAQPVFMSHLP